MHTHTVHTRTQIYLHVQSTVRVYISIVSQFVTLLPNVNKLSSVIILPLNVVQLMSLQLKYTLM